MNRRRIRAKEKGSNDSIAARKTGGDYFCDYRPRYEETYSIYDKAKKHIKNLKKGVDNQK